MDKAYPVLVSAPNATRVANARRIGIQVPAHIAAVTGDATARNYFAAIHHLFLVEVGPHITLQCVAWARLSTTISASIRPITSGDGALRPRGRDTICFRRCARPSFCSGQHIMCTALRTSMTARIGRNRLRFSTADAALHHHSQWLISRQT